MGHRGLRIKRAGIDHRGDLAVADQNHEQIGDHRGLAFGIQRVGEFLLVEFP